MNQFGQSNSTNTQLTRMLIKLYQRLDKAGARSAIKLSEFLLKISLLD